MKKNVKKIFSVLLICIMTLSAIPVYAETNSGYVEDSYIGLEEYISKSEEGVLVFDSEGAAKAGYDSKTISNVNLNIDTINYLVQEEGAILNDDFSATLYIMSARTKGVTKTVVHWYGLTEVWMNSDDTEEFIRQLEGGAGVIDWLGDRFGNVVSGIVSGATGLYVAAVKAAAAPGNGIIMYSQYDGTSMSTLVWFTSQ